MSLRFWRVLAAIVFVLGLAAVWLAYFAQVPLVVAFPFVLALLLIIPKARPRH